MNLTFGIMTTYDNVPQLNEVIASIKALNAPDVEIIVAGSYNNNPWTGVNPSVKQVLTHGWTPVKKNLVAKVARHENLVLIHDYYLFDKDWYERWDAFDRLVRRWDIASNPQYLITGKRHFTDWVIWDHPTLPRYHSLDYRDWLNTQYQYVSGGYFLVKRDFLRQYPFDERMQPGSAEDVEWSLRVRHRGVMVCNPLATVRHNKVHRDAK
jgi:GT2 family glycosyltransferase